MIARALTVDGVYDVDLDAEEVVEHDPAGTIEPAPRPEVGLPRVVAAAAAGATVVAVVDARPPLLVSHDAGATWSASGRGLPAGFAVAVAEENPDVVVFAARNRLYLSRDGGRFWSPLPLELPDVLALEI